MPEHPAGSAEQSPIPVIRRERPRLLRPFDDPDFGFETPADAVRRRILDNLLADCELYAPGGRGGASRGGRTAPIPTTSST